MVNDWNGLKTKISEIILLDSNMQLSAPVADSSVRFSASGAKGFFFKSSKVVFQIFI
jgi:hypothetical protein